MDGKQLFLDATFSSFMHLNMNILNILMHDINMHTEKNIVMEYFKFYYTQISRTSFFKDMKCL